jgi:hypothetical protein
MHEPKDIHGKVVAAGARVRLVFAPPELVSGLPEEDRAAILDVVDKELVIEGFDSYGHAELMFTDRGGRIHFIWVQPKALEALF